MIIRNGKEVKYVARKGKFQNQIDRKDKDGNWNTVFPSPPWWEKYGVMADYVVSNGIDNWIDTYIGTQPDLIIEMGITYLESGREQSGFGAYDLNNVVIEAGSVTSGGNAFYAYDDDRTWDVRAFDVELNKHYNLKYNFQNGLQVVYIDDVEVHRTTNTSGALVGIAMVLFARNYGGTSGTTRQNFMNAKWTHFKVSKSDGTVLADYRPFYISKKPMVDWKNRTHEVGGYTMIDMVREKATPLYGEPLEGYVNLESEFYFKSTSEQNPYYDLGKRIAYGKRIEIPISFEDTTIDPYPLYGLFGSRQGYSQSTAYNTFIGRNDLPMATDVPIALIPTDRKFTITIEDGKGYIDGVLTTTDTTPVSDWNQNSFLYNINTEGLGGAMTTYRLPIGTKVYGCKIYDVATGVLENAYLPQEDQTLKCAITGEILHKLGINSTDSWEVKHIVWWKDYGSKIDYIENVDNESYILTDVTPIPNELSLDIDCMFLNDITSVPFGCRPTETASTSSNNIFQVNNTLRIDLLGDASLTIPKENNISYNIIYNGADNIFTINDESYNGSVEKSSVKVEYPFAIFANNSGGILSVGSACIMRYNKFNINNKQYVPIQVTKTFVDSNNVTHNIDDFIMVNELAELDVPTHVGEFTGSQPIEKSWEDYGVLVESIQNADINSYIDTKYIPIGNEVINVTVNNPTGSQFLEDKTYLFGIYESEDNKFGAYTYWRTDIEKNSISCFPNPIGQTLSLTDDVDLTLIMNLNSKYYGAGTTKYTLDYETFPTQTKSFYLFTANSYSTSAIQPPVKKFEIVGLMELVPLKITKKPITDASGRVHEIGSYVMYDIINNIVPPHIGNFVGGEEIVEWWREYGEKAHSVIFDGVTNYLDTNVNMINMDGRFSYGIKGARLNFDKEEVFVGARVGEGDTYSSLIPLSVNAENFAVIDASNIVGSEITEVTTLGQAEFFDTTGYAFTQSSTKRAIVSNKVPIVSEIFLNTIINPDNLKASMYMFALNDNGVMKNPAKVRIERVSYDGYFYEPLYITKKDLITERGNVYPIGSYALVCYDEERVSHIGGNLLDGNLVEGELAYVLSDDGTYYINTGRGNNISNQIIVPEIYKGKPVYEIAENAYKDDKDLYNIRFETVRKIGNSAFEGSGLYEIEGRYENFELGENIFKDCVNVKLIDIGVIYDIPNGMFEGCVNVEHAEFGYYNESIGDRAFKGCSKLATFDFSENLKTIGEEAFFGCDLLTTLDFQNCEYGAVKIANINSIPTTVEKVYTLNYLIYDYANNPIWMQMPDYESKIEYIKNYTDFAEHADYVVADGSQYINTNTRMYAHSGRSLVRVSASQDQGGYLYGYINKDDTSINISVGCVNNTWEVNCGDKFNVGANVVDSVNTIFWNRPDEFVEFNGTRIDIGNTINAVSGICFVLNRNDGSNAPYDSNFVGKLYNVTLIGEFNYQPIKLTQDYGGYTSGSYVLWDMENETIVETNGVFTEGL